ncbi:MAG: hypothetical protein N6V49_09405, partial [Serratia symbiotica]|nr:hypothetical protein [Serratia symbiotica]
MQRGFQVVARLLRGIGAGVDAISGVCPGFRLGRRMGYLYAVIGQGRRLAADRVTLRILER